jgi:hypothetical protein
MGRISQAQSRSSTKSRLAPTPLFIQYEKAGFRRPRFSFNTKSRLPPARFSFNTKKPASAGFFANPIVA